VIPHLSYLSAHNQLTLNGISSSLCHLPFKRVFESICIHFLERHYCLGTGDTSRSRGQSYLPRRLHHLSDSFVLLQLFLLL
jgi:hypothetical protein